MSSRLTTNWTPTAEGAYGATGKKGKTAEDIHDNLMVQYGFEVLSCENNREFQEMGIDSVIILDQCYITTDIKGNWRLDGSFYVEAGVTGWLRNSRKPSTHITHVNTNTGKMFCYRRSDMVAYVSIHRVPTVVKNGIELYLFDKTRLTECDFVTYIN